MMQPSPLGTMRRPAAWAHRNTPVRLMSTARRHSSGVTSSDGLLAEMPALLTSTSMPPQACSTWAKARSTASASVTEACAARASPPAARSPATAASSATGSMSSSATRAPWRTNASAVA